jgi:hypothetical protein
MGDRTIGNRLLAAGLPENLGTKFENYFSAYT